MVEAKDQGQNFSELWWENFPLLLGVKVFKDVAFR